MGDDDGDRLPPPERLPDGRTLEARFVDGGAGIELSLGSLAQIIRFPVDRVRPPDGGEGGRDGVSGV